MPTLSFILALTVSALALAGPVDVVKRDDGTCSALDPQICVVNGVNHKCSDVRMKPDSCIRKDFTDLCAIGCFLFLDLSLRRPWTHFGTLHIRKFYQSYKGLYSNQVANPSIVRVSTSGI
jgi:hypothetical protein